MLLNNLQGGIFACVLHLLHRTKSNIDVAIFECRITAVLVRDELHDDFVEMLRGGIPIVWVAHQHHAAILVPLAKHIGARADRLAVHVLLGAGFIFRRHDPVEKAVERA